MELKDKLKKLRMDQGMTQSELANAIFVSRSAIAKWENGLGMPSEESLNALSAFFGVPKDCFFTKEPEAVIVEKNKRIDRLKKYLIPGYYAVLLLLLAVGVLLWRGYRFTSASAVDEYYHQFPVIRTDDYNFYLNHKEAATGVEAVKKTGFLFKNTDGYWRPLETTDGTSIGRLYCFDGKTVTYYFLMTYGYCTEMGTTEDGKAYATVSYPYRTQSITLNGEYVGLDFYSYFSTAEPIESLKIKGEEIRVLPRDTDVD